MEATTSTLLGKAQELLKKRQYRDSLALLQQIESEPLNGTDLGMYCLTKGEILLFLEDYSTDYLDQAIGIFKKSSENRNFAHAKYLKGWQLQLIGESLKAKEPLIESYTAFLRIDDYESAARALNRLARVSFQCGDIGSAVDSLVKSISFYSRAGNVVRCHSVRVNLCLVHFVSGAIIKSLESYRNLKESYDLIGAKNKCVF